LKILIVKPSSLGDIVQALPVLRFLKRYLPGSEIYWWVDSAFAPLLEGDPDLAGIVRFERRRWAEPKHWPELWRSIRCLRAEVFDWVIDLQSLARSGAVAWLANGKLTVGLDEPREGARGFYDLIVPRPSFHTHAVDWYLGVLPLLGLPRPDPSASASQGAMSSGFGFGENFHWLALRPEVASNIRQKWAVNGSRWLVLQPGARWQNKRWPAEHFAELVCLLSERQSNLTFAILGTEQDRPLGKLIAEACPDRCVDLTGKISLLEMVEWIRLADLLVTNDTGPMHVAAALNTPLVALFGPTEPRRTGPYGQLTHVLQLQLPCEPCLRPRCYYSRPIECLRAISASEVVQAVEQRLGASGKAF